MNIAILGYDVEGSASYEYYSSLGHDVTICDQNPDCKVPEGADAVLGENYLDNLGRFDQLVRTPGMHPAKILSKNPGVADKITSATNEFFKVCPSRNIIGVTGTKGKGTTSTLIAKILEAAGKTVHLGGNIGVPALSFVNEVGADDWVVLELSSFQLIDLKQSPRIAVCLMVVPEHLNWHADFAEYMDAKRQLFVHQTSEDTTIYNADNDASADLASSSSAVKIPYSLTTASGHGAYVQDGTVYMAGTEICRVDEIALLGAHNWQNICAATAATWEVIGRDREAIRSVVTTFQGLEHRLELVRSLDGVAYYDDSFGTTPETAIVAIQAFQEPKIVILGGSDKGSPYTELARTVAVSNVKHALLIGETAHDIEEALRAEGFTATSPGGADMTEIVAKARNLAASGDVVVLSTACASFDMFANYKDRGEKFQRAVNALQPVE